MSKLFTVLAALVFLVVAAGHAYRLYERLTVTIGSHEIPFWVSWAGAALAGLLAVMLLVEARR